jgi:hypothetical protein
MADAMTQSQLRFFNLPLNTAASPNWDAVMKLLQDFCNEVETVTQQHVKCVLLPGFTTNLGTEYRATAHSQGKNIDHILFRVHVPFDGLPLNFDFYEDDMRKCENLDDVSIALGDFAAQEATRETLRLLSQ